MPMTASLPCQTGDLQRECTVTSTSPSTSVKVVSCDRKIYNYIHSSTTPMRTQIGVFVQSPIGGAIPAVFGEATKAIWPYDRHFIPNSEA